MVDAVFFDVDGVLIDSVGVKGVAFVDAFADYPDRGDAILAFHEQNGGLPRGSKIHRIIEDVYGREATSDEVDRVTRLFADSVVERVVAAPEIPGASAALAALGAGIPLHAVSATPLNELTTILGARGWLGHFRSIHGMPPDKAATVRRLIARHGYRASKCFLVGDSVHDQRAAQANSVPFVFVSPDQHDRISDAVAVIPDLVSLPHCLLDAPRMDS